MQKTIKKIDVTGGPSGGKTTALSYAEQRLMNLGYLPIIRPEIATLLINAGITPWGNNFDTLEFQKQILLMTQMMDERFIRIASLSKKENVVVLGDRGLMDGQAYVEKDLFLQALHSTGLNIVSARDESCDAIMHLVTAALGAEEFYTLENNKARTETPEQARILDANTQTAWIGHPHMRVIDNSFDFKTKIDRLYEEICVVLGIPVPLEIENKYLVEEMILNDIPVQYEVVNITQDYILPRKGFDQERVRKRGQHGIGHTYYHTRKRKIDSKKQAEVERRISESEYNLLLQEKDLEFKTIKKERACFIYKNQYFELDHFIEQKTDSWLLEIELTRENVKVDLPPFIKVKKEVTSDSKYSNYEIARIG